MSLTHQADRTVPVEAHALLALAAFHQHLEALDRRPPLKAIMVRNRRLHERLRWIGSSGCQHFSRGWSKGRFPTRECWLKRS